MHTGICLRCPTLIYASEDDGSHICRSCSAPAPATRRGFLGRLLATAR